MAVIKNNKTGMWEVRTYYKDLTGARKQKTKRGICQEERSPIEIGLAIGKGKALMRCLSWRMTALRTGVPRKSAVF